MSYRPLKKDLTDGTEKCHFCNRSLNSLKAYILEDVNTKVKVFSGPQCAKNNIDHSFNLAILPDLTKYTLSITEKEQTLKTKTSERKNSKHSEKEVNLRKAIEYIELRENKLSKEFNTSYNVLRDYYNYYINNGSLKTDEINHILNIENKSPQHYKLINLQKCYNYIFWINNAIARLDEGTSKYLKGVKEYLIKNYKISDKQKIGVNKWLENLNGIPQLK